MTFLALIAVLGFLVSILSGLLGIGGGIVMAPVLLYLPLVLGMPGLTMAEVSGLTVTQGLFACLVAAIRHNKHRNVNYRLTIWMGATITVSALAGSFLSVFVDDSVLIFTFTGLAGVAAILMFLGKNTSSECLNGRDLEFNVKLAVTIAATVGILGGMVGQGGSFILIPLMLYILKLPTRVVIGSNLAIVFMSSLAGFTGKFATGQIPLLPAAFLLAGALLGATLGAKWSQQTKPIWLKRSLACVVALAAIGVGLNAFL